MYWIVETETLSQEGGDGWFDANGKVLRKFEVVTEAPTAPFSKKPIDEGFCGEFCGKAVRAHGKFETVEAARDAAEKLTVPGSHLVEWDQDWLDESAKARWDAYPEGCECVDPIRELWNDSDIKDVLTKHSGDVAATVKAIRDLCSGDGVWPLDVEEAVREVAEDGG
jgi:hypothetical protein